MRHGPLVIVDKVAEARCIDDRQLESHAIFLDICR